ncbi:venom allergen 5.02-like isoform X3 [Nilaparvata lugens]|uniref:venom allergen 5.02-like isoform X3 n=1 Tax=Nilaparvata lugens TaxID=108931 RepID=UPI00193DA83F|nr:venom allergen 5.02-like isoform X3 [Nilaparvata lugens]
MVLSTIFYSRLLFVMSIVIAVTLTIISKIVMDKLFGPQYYTNESQGNTNVQNSSETVCKGHTSCIEDNDSQQGEKNNQRIIVNTHNRLRATVALGQLESQPPAQNMQLMNWDSKLASRAQFWADQHMFKHDDDRGENIGQNMYIVHYGGPHTKRHHNFTKVIISWYGEHVFYRYKKLQKGDSNDRRTQTGHFTQVVWANTNKVGCGFASFLENKQDQILYVCNYAPSGNYKEEYPYIKGEPDCKAHGMMNSNIKGLCTNS